MRPEHSRAATPGNLLRARCEATVLERSSQNVGRSQASRRRRRSDLATRSTRTGLRDVRARRHRREGESVHVATSTLRGGRWRASSALAKGSRHATRNRRATHVYEVRRHLERTGARRPAHCLTRRGSRDHECPRACGCQRSDVRGAGSPRAVLPVLPARASPARVARLGPGTPRPHPHFKGPSAANARDGRSRGGRVRVGFASTLGGHARHRLQSSAGNTRQGSCRVPPPTGAVSCAAESLTFSPAPSGWSS
jgi:hypothetical protein